MISISPAVWLEPPEQKMLYADWASNTSMNSSRLLSTGWMLASTARRPPRQGESRFMAAPPFQWAGGF